MVSSNTHSTSFSTDSTVISGTPQLARSSSNSSSTYTLKAHDFFSSYNFLKSNKDNNNARNHVAGNKASESHTSTTPTTTTAQPQSITYDPTLPNLEALTPSLTLHPPALFPNSPTPPPTPPHLTTTTTTATTTTTLSLTESTYDPAEFTYSTPPYHRKSLYSRVKSFLKTFHIVRHWPKYESKLERKLAYLREDAEYWKGEVEERVRAQEERREREQMAREEKERREREEKEMREREEKERRERVGLGNVTREDHGC